MILHMKRNHFIDIQLITENYLNETSIEKKPCPFCKIIFWEGNSSWFLMHTKSCEILSKLTKKTSDSHICQLCLRNFPGHIRNVTEHLKEKHLEISYLNENEKTNIKG